MPYTKDCVSHEYNEPMKWLSKDGTQNIGKHCKNCGHWHVVKLTMQNILGLAYLELKEYDQLNAQKIADKNPNILKYAEQVMN